MIKPRYFCRGKFFFNMWIDIKGKNKNLFAATIAVVEDQDLVCDSAAELRSTAPQWV